ncbi:MAG: hypothetical protein K2M16_06485, partial [Muribaculaceae bacterium]|nr:hypothetical protein [Muribaculaceae bacterium]
NYVRDNCATRPWKRITQASDREILLPDTLYYPTFRSEMKHFHSNYPWYQFGIDLVLGSGLDYPLERDEDTFAPPVLSAKLAEATIGGVPLVRETNMIFTGYADATLPPTPWYLTPMAVGIVMLLLGFGTMFAYVLRKSLWKWWIFLYFLTAGIAGCIVAFLVFCSEHEATSPNLLILWLNPFQLVIAAGIWWKSWRLPVTVMAAYDLVMTLVLTALIAAHIVAQRLNPATWPMLLTILPLSATLLFSKKSTKALTVTKDLKDLHP